jgi:hypothetical protein
VTSTIIGSVYGTHRCRASIATVARSPRTVVSPIAIRSCRWKPPLGIKRQASLNPYPVPNSLHQGNLRCRQCDKVQNPRDQGLSYGDHSTQCHGGGSIHRRHNSLKNILYHTLKAAGYRPQMETAHLIPGSLIHPGNVYVPVCDDGMAVAYDVTVVSPVVESSLFSSARSFGFAADTAEHRKAVHYAINCTSQGIYFIPLAQETLGGWSVQAGKISSLLADRIADRKVLQRATCRSALFRELGIATQRSIARDIIERSGRLPEQASAQLIT